MGASRGIVSRKIEIYNLSDIPSMEDLSLNKNDTLIYVLELYFDIDFNIEETIKEIVISSGNYNQVFIDGLKAPVVRLKLSVETDVVWFRKNCQQIEEIQVPNLVNKEELDIIISDSVTIRYL